MSDLLNQASLVMVPSGYKEDTVYSVVPSDGSGDLSFTRASNGTRVNSAGLVEVVPWNLVQYSEDFAQAGPIWNKYQATITSNATTAPNGTLTADSITDNTSNDVHIAYQDMAGIVAGTYTISVYAKASTLSHINLQWYSGSAFYTSNAFNLSNGTTTGANQSIESVGNGWYRCIFTFTTTVSGLQYPYIMTNNGTSNVYVGTGQSVFIWGCQLNIGSTAKPYFPTTDRLNVPRLTYQNGGGGCPSLLLEKQSTNLFTYSEQMDNSDWFKNNLTITANSTTSPDGTQNADLLDDGTASSTQHWIYQGTSFSNSTAYTISFYAKYVSRKYMAVNIYNGATSQYVVYDIQNGSVYGSTGDVTASITSVGNGWYRVVYTRTMSASGSPNFRIAMADDTGNETYTGSNKQVYLWGMQCEASSYVTSYIVSTSSSATRVLDECSKTGISSLIGQTEGVLFVDFVFTAYDYDPKWVAFLGGGASYIGIYTQSTPEFVCEIANSGVPQFFSNTYVFSVGQRYKLAIAYKANDFAFYVNGTQVATDSSGTVPATSQFSLQYNTATANLTSRIYNQVALFPTRLTNAELASLTTI